MPLNTAAEIPVLRPGGDPTAPLDLNNAQDAAAKTLYEDSLPAVVQIRTNKGSGTGFFFEDGDRIITAAHVVQGSNEHFVVTPDGTKYKLMLEKMDDINDVAVLRAVGLPAGARPFLQLAKDSALKPQQPLFAIGHPLGLRPAFISPGAYESRTTTLDFVLGIAPNSMSSVSKRVYNWTPKEMSDLTDSMDRPLVHSLLHIRHGNSGGPLLDADRKVVGIADMINPKNPTQSYFVPIEKVHDLLNGGASDKFDFTYTRKGAQWTQDYISHWRNDTSQAVLETGTAGVLGYAGVQAMRRIPFAGAGFGALGAGLLVYDGSSLLDSTDPRDKLKYSIAGLSDITTIAGSIATIVPKARPFGIAAVGLGLIGRAASDFIPNRLVLTDVNRKNGENRGPFLSPL